MEKEINEDVIDNAKRKGSKGLNFCKIATAVIVVLWLISVIITFVMMVMGSINVANVAQVPGIEAALVLGNFVMIFLTSILSGFFALILILAIWGIYYLIVLCKKSYNNRGSRKEYKEKLDKQNIEVKEINRISEEEVKQQEEELFK